MMTEEQILQMVKEYFTEEWYGWGWTEFSGKPDAFVKFAQAIYQEGFDEGRYEQVLEHMNYPEDYFTG